ncbi:MAG: tetratricopeptide repeat protein [Candidatus Saccharibacteria bacterium]|nr:tetratricopeptide repeat protein [Candidatus Saccharibacteria bacterium]
MNSQRPFDLKKLDFTAIRIRRRKRLLLYSLPLCIIASVISLKFLSIAAFSALAHDNYQHNQFGGAISWLRPLHITNWFEPYKAPFNQGNALFKKGDVADAATMYRKALEVVPTQHECDVRINLALSLERLGDIAVSEKKMDEAILHYDQVKAVLRDGRDSCGIDITETPLQQRHDKDGDKSGDKSGDSPEGGDKQPSNKSGNGAPSDQSNKESAGSSSNSQAVKTIESRVSDKLDKAKRGRNNDNQNTQQLDDASPTDTKSTEEKIKALETKSNNARQQRAKSQKSRRQSANYEKNREHRYDRKNW